MPLVTGKLTDFGLDPMPGNDPRVVFTYTNEAGRPQPGIAKASILASHPVVSVPAHNGFFEAELNDTASISPAGYYTVALEWRDDKTRVLQRELLPGRLYVPPAGGILADLLRVPSNPALVWDGTEPPGNPSPGTWWLDDDGQLLEHDGNGWNYKQNLRGPAGYMATGAAEDDEAISRFVHALAGQTATRFAIESYFVRKGAERANVKDYGATGDGKTDDTAAIHAALAAADIVFFPRGIYRTTGIKVPPRTALVGAWTREYTAEYAEVGARIKAIRADMTDPVVDLTGSGSKLEGLLISGTGPGPKHDALKMGNQGIVDQCTIIGAHHGINAGYRNGNVITNNQIHYHQGSGILNPLDTVITHNTINSNQSHGISMQAGAGDNSIGFNKIEWNNGRGISMQASPHVNIVSNVIDRNGLCGIFVLDTNQGVCGPNIVRRNGRLAEGKSDDNTNMFSQGNSNYTFLGNQTEAGADDGGGGYRSPLSAMRIIGGTDVAYIGNNFKGGTERTVNVVTSGTGDIFVGNLGYKGPQEALGVASVAALAPGAAHAETFAVPSVGTYNNGRLYQIALTARNGGGSKYSATITAQIAREGGPASVAGSRVDIITGAEGTVGAEGTAIAAVISTSETGGALTLTVTNKTSTPMQIRLGVTPL